MMEQLFGVSLEEMMRRPCSLLLLLTLFTILTGCKARKMAEEAAISKDFEKKGTRQLLEESAKDQYDPPADGRLTDEQVRMYLKVRDHEKKIAAVAKQELEEHARKVKEKGDKSFDSLAEAFKGVGSIADFATADIRAASDLGYNTAEYRWVKGQILEVSGAVITQKMQQANLQAIESQREQLEKQRDAATEEASRKFYQEMLDNYEKVVQDMSTTNQDPAVAYNRQLLEKYENALQAIASEWSKFEDEEKVQRSMADLEQRLDASADEPANQP